MPTITRRGLIGECSCKVGACRKCGSRCKRCKCSCDGVSPLEAVKMFNQNIRNKKRKRRPKRLKAIDKIIVEPMIKKSKKRQVEGKNGEDDSEFTPALSMNGSTVCRDILNSATNTISDKSVVDTNPKDRRDQFWKYNDIPLQTVIELHNLLKSFQKTKAITMFSEFIENVISNHNEKSSATETFIKMGDIMKECLLPSSMIEELSIVLFGVDKLKNGGVKTRNEKKGKNLITLTALKRRIRDLSQKCNTIDDEVEVVHDDSNSINSSNSSKISSIKTTNRVHRIEMVHNDKLMETNIDTLTDDVLNLPREYRPIRLANDKAISTKATADKQNDPEQSSKATAKVDVPSLPAFANEIYLDTVTMENNSLAADELTVSVDNADIPESNEIKKRKKIESKISQLIDMFELPQYQKSVLPSASKRNTSTNLRKDNQLRYSRMVHLGHKLINGVLQSLCPGPSRSLLQKDILKKMTRGYEINGMDTDEARYNRISNALCLCTKMSKKNTIERRICRAILYNSVTGKKQLEEMMERYDFTFSHGDARKKARSDFDLLSKGEVITMKKKYFARIDDNVLLKAVNFILSEDNCVSTSYGTKVVQLSEHENIQLPRFQRKRSRIDIIRAYLNLTSDDKSQLSQRSMYNILNYITSTDQASLYAIDYVTSLLVNETAEVIQDIIDKLVPSDEAKHASRLLSTASYFLKHKFKHHIVLNDDVCYHGLSHALKRKKDVSATITTNESNDTVITSTDTSQDSTTRTTTTNCNMSCNACKFPFFVCSTIKQYIQSSTNHMEGQVEDAMRVIDDTSKKYELYMAHIARCTNQVHAINDKEKELETLCMNSKGKEIGGMLIIDFKMKFEAQSTRESSVEHFGKRGIAWHGCALIYYLYETKKNDDGSTMKDTNGNEIYYAKKYLVYVDQILTNSNKQDGMSVLGLLESCLTSLHSQLPFISQLTIQSDNATTYQNGHLIVGIHLLNMKMKGKLFVNDFIHSETQHGKTILDAHFASTNRHLKNFMLTYTQNRVTRIQTPHGLAFSLSFNTGVKNTMVQLIELNEMKLNEISIAVHQVVKNLKTYFTRVNHIYYEEPKNDYVTPYEIMSAISNLKFKLKVQAFSNIDEPTTFVVDMSKNTFKHVNLIDEENDDVHKNSDEGNEVSIVDNDNTITTSPTEHVDFAFSRRGNHTKHNLRNKSISDLEKQMEIKEDNCEEDDSSTDDDYVSESSEEDDSETETLLNRSVKTSNIRQYGPPVGYEYDENSMITGVKILKMQEFGTISAFKKHVKKKELATDIEKIICVRKDSYAKAVRYAKQIVSSSDYFHDANEENNPLFDLASEYTPESSFAKDSSWARRKGYGQLYGETYMNEYKEHLLNMFNDGCSKSANKMNPGKMREVLTNMFPHKFSIPSELEIKKFISSESQKKKITSKTTKKTSETRGRKPKGTALVWTTLLQPFIERNVDSKPEDIYKLFLEEISINNQSLPPDLPMDEIGEMDKKRIKSRINQERAKIRNRTKRDLI